MKPSQRAALERAGVALPKGAKILRTRVPQFIPDSARKIGVDFACGDCGRLQARTGAMQKYCEPCSRARANLRRIKWEQEHPLAHKESIRKYDSTKRSRVVQAGMMTNATERWGVDSVFPDETGMLWVRRIALPYRDSLSKNYIYRMSRHGHVYLRKESMAAKAELADALAIAVRDVKVAINKVWMAIVVQKPNHKSDAINVVDAVADGVKVGLGIDDRWFSIRQVDWQIVKTDPEIFIGIGQESDVDLHVCSHCGRPLPYDMFWKNANAKQGITRGCKDCMKSVERRRR